MAEGTIPEGAAALAGLVEVQAGAIVSRTLVKKERGTVTLFAFDAGQALSEHTAPFDALVFVIEGEATVVVGGKPHDLRRGDAILLPADVPHAVMAVSRFKMLLTMIRA